jgi:hypothetical protein
MDVTEGTDDARASEPSSTPRRSSRIGVALVVAGVVCAAAAIALVGIALRARSEASDARAAASTARRAQRVEEVQRVELARSIAALRELEGTIQTKAEALAPAVLAAGNSLSEIGDVESRAAAAYNSGDPNGAAASWQTDGKTALDHVDAKVASTDELLQEAHRLVQQLKDAA